MKIRNNLLREIKQYYHSQLSKIYGRHEASALLNLLIHHFFNLSRTDQSLNPGFRLTETEMLKLHFAVKELKNEKPVQYIIGETEFAGLTLKVTPDVLIPRPETEELVEKIVSKNNSDKQLKILDIGTGSGCIALALKKRLPHSKVTAIDISLPALEVAEQNSTLNNLQLSLLQMDILNADSRNLPEKFDIIVSNPPYVTLSDKKQMRNNVIDYEPHQALFVNDNNPLVFYKSIAGFASTHLNKTGVLWFEINENLGREAAVMLKSKGYRAVTLHRDIHNKTRFVSCYPDPQGDL